MSIVPQVGLEPTRLTSRHPKCRVATITPSGYFYHIRQAFYFPQARNCILFNPTLAVRVPEDMIFKIEDTL